MIYRIFYNKPAFFSSFLSLFTVILKINSVCLPEDI